MKNSLQNPSILIVEDDNELADLISEYLSGQGFAVAHVSNGNDVEKFLADNTPALIILDVMLPGQSGMDVCKQIRPSYQGMILMLTALDEDLDQMLGLELGADDYVVKPVKPRLLLSRVKALLRRQPSSSFNNEVQQLPNKFEIGDLLIDEQQRKVYFNNEAVSLTGGEFDLLALLAKSAGQLVSRDHILMEIRGFEYDGLDRSIDRRVSRLRKKLLDATAQDFIATARGKGYQLRVIGAQGK